MNFTVEALPTFLLIIIFYPSQPVNSHFCDTGGTSVQSRSDLTSFQFRDCSWKQFGEKVSDSCVFQARVFQPLMNHGTFITLKKSHGTLLNKADILGAMEGGKQAAFLLKY